jgi:hypothetical protein
MGYIVYDITEKNISATNPDVLPDELQPRTIIANAIYLEWDIEDSIEDVEGAREEVLVCFCAVIGYKNDFKVYYNFGDRFTPETLVNGHSPKIRTEAFARKLFPMLDGYEFKTQ